MRILVLLFVILFVTSVETNCRYFSFARNYYDNRIEWKQNRVMATQDPWDSVVEFTRRLFSCSFSQISKQIALTKDFPFPMLHY